MFQIDKALCDHCNGRGYHRVKKGVIVDHKGNEIADTYRKGENCHHCKGTGEVGLYFASRRFAQIVMAACALYFAWQLFFR